MKRLKTVNTFANGLVLVLSLYELMWNHNVELKIDSTNSFMNCSYSIDVNFSGPKGGKRRDQCHLYQTTSLDVLFRLRETRHTLPHHFSP